MATASSFFCISSLHYSQEFSTLVLSYKRITTNKTLLLTQRMSEFPLAHLEEENRPAERAAEAAKRRKKNRLKSIALSLGIHAAAVGAPAAYEAASSYIAARRAAESKTENPHATLTSEYKGIADTSKEAYSKTIEKKVEIIDESHKIVTDPELGIYSLPLEKKEDGKWHVTPGYSNRVDWIRFYLQNRVRQGQLSPEEAAKKELAARGDIEKFKEKAKNEPDRKKVMHEILDSRGAYAADDNKIEDIIVTAEDIMHGREPVGNCYSRAERNFAYIQAVYPDTDFVMQEFVHHIRPIAIVGDEWLALDYTPAPIYKKNLEGTVILEPANSLSGYLNTEKDGTYHAESPTTKHPRAKRHARKDDISRDMSLTGHVPSVEVPDTLPSEQRDADTISKDGLAPTAKFNGGGAPAYAPAHHIDYASAQATLTGQNSGGRSEPLETFIPGRMEVTITTMDEFPPANGNANSNPDTWPDRTVKHIHPTVERTPFLSAVGYDVRHPKIDYKDDYGETARIKERPNTLKGRELAKAVADFSSADAPGAVDLYVDHVTFDLKELINSEVKSITFRESYIKNPELLSLTPITKLTINGLEHFNFNKFTAANITELDLKNFSAPDMEASIARMTRLKKLSFENVDIKDYSFLKDLKVEVLTIDGRRLTSEQLSRLSSAAQNVAHVNILTAHFVDLQCLAQLNMVEELDLTFSHFEKFSGIENLPHLTTLSIPYTKFDHQPTYSGGFQNLEVLVANDTVLDTIEPWRDSHKMRVLDLSMSKVVSIAVARNMPLLERVDLSGLENLHDISPLTGAHNLKKLRIADRCGVTDLTPIKGVIDNGQIKIILDKESGMEVDASTYQVVPKGTAKKVYKNVEIF